mgnify:CR=1 FL=1
MRIGIESFWMDTKDSEQNKLGEEIYQQLQKIGIEVLLDDRADRAGVKFKDADLIGIPWRVVVGRDAKSGQIELTRRSSKESKLVPTEDGIKELKTSISNEKRICPV